MPRRPQSLSSSLTLRTLHTPDATVEDYCLHIHAAGEAAALQSRPGLHCVAFAHLLHLRPLLQKNQEVPKHTGALLLLLLLAVLLLGCALTWPSALSIGGEDLVPAAREPVVFERQLSLPSAVLALRRDPHQAAQGALITFSASRTRPSPPYAYVFIYIYTYISIYTVLCVYISTYAFGVDERSCACAPDDVRNAYITRLCRVSCVACASTGQGQQANRTGVSLRHSADLPHEAHRTRRAADQASLHHHLAHLPARRMEGSCSCYPSTSPLPRRVFSLLNNDDNNVVASTNRAKTR